MGLNAAFTKQCVLDGLGRDKWTDASLYVRPKSCQIGIKPSTNGAYALKRDKDSPVSRLLNCGSHIWKQADELAWLDATLQRKHSHQRQFPLIGVEDGVFVFNVGDGEPLSGEKWDPIGPAHRSLDGLPFIAFQKCDLWLSAELFRMREVAGSTRVSIEYDNDRSLVHLHFHSDSSCPRSRPLHPGKKKRAKSTGERMQSDARRVAHGGIPAWVEAGMRFPNPELRRFTPLVHGRTVTVRIPPAFDDAIPTALVPKAMPGLYAYSDGKELVSYVGHGGDIAMRAQSRERRRWTKTYVFLAYEEDKAKRERKEHYALLRMEEVNGRLPMHQGNNRGNCPRDGFCCGRSDGSAPKASGDPFTAPSALSGANPHKLNIERWKRRNLGAAHRRKTGSER